MSNQFETISRVQAPELDKILGTPFKVLDDGFVRVVDYMGSDESIVQAARVSYGKGTKTPSGDRELLRYLIRHKHTSPFEMCEIKLHIRVPMDCWRQWIRHRTANVNEYSTRYSVAIDSAYKVKPDEWRMQALVNKQASEGLLDAQAGAEFTKREAELQKMCREEYQRRIDAGVARELARKDLPLATYTEAYWKIDLSNLLHFLELRMERKAQYEIRVYSNIIGEEIVSRWCPNAWEAFKDYRLKSVTLSEVEQRVLALVLKGKNEEAANYLREIKFLSEKDGKLKSSVECVELENKLKEMGHSIPWLK
ncbi:MAG: FAD-dependent thymidylate synthase [Elusimicrobiota bacterium]